MPAYYGARRILMMSPILPPPWLQVQKLLGTDLLGQFDATNGATITLSGAAVTAFTDPIAGLTLNPGGATTRPLYNGAYDGGGPCVVADGIDDYLSSSTVPYPIGANPCEWWAVVDQESLVADTTGRRIFSYGPASSTTSTARMFYRTVPAGVNRFGAIVGDGTSTAITETTVDFSGWHVVRMRMTGTDVLLYVDGSAPTTAARVPTTVGGITAMFCNQTVNGQFFKGALSCLLVTNLLSTEKASALLAQLQERY